MNLPDGSEGFRTLRGFLSGSEPDEPNYFKFSANLRVHGDGLPFAEIEQALGVAPTHLHRKGERLRPTAAPFRDDAWHYEPPVPQTEPLGRHLDALWEVVRPATGYLKALKSRHRIDVFCGYRSNCDTAGFAVPHTSLELFAALEIPFGMSVIVA